MGRKHKEIRITDSPNYYKNKMAEWRKENPLCYCITIEGKNYAFTKEVITRKLRLNKVIADESITFIENNKNIDSSETN